MRTTFVFLAGVTVGLASAGAAYVLVKVKPWDRSEGPVVLLQDRFNDGVLNDHTWLHVWWSAEERGGRLRLSSPPPADDGKTHAALVRSKQAWRNYLLTLDVHTVRQLRRGKPNPWEVGWVWFRVQDPRRAFYYLILKPIGAELGKVHGPRGQVSLVTTSSPTFPVGRTNRVRIRVWNNLIKIWVNGLPVIEYTDPNAIESGGIGLYEEDSHVWFDNVRVAPVSGNTGPPVAAS